MTTANGVTSRDHVLELARAHGFTLRGIALLDETRAPRADTFAQWLSDGHHGPLGYMLTSADERQEPHKRHPWAKSVLMLGVFYDPHKRGKPGMLSAHVSRYAQGRDYHKIFESRLKRLTRVIRESGICERTHWHTDTGPVLERAWAEKAGLGWTGKNTCLINPALGSYFLIASVFLDVDLTPDKPAGFHCGTCTRCMDACPTQALTAPGVLDARLCLTTWNLERPDISPPEMWSASGSWAAGCDICQEVCPYNRPQRTNAVPVDVELSRPLPWAGLTVADCIVMTTEIFGEKFVGSALRRTGLIGMRLGAITVAGNLKLDDCRDALRICLSDANENIRARAEWALARFQK